jgi:hypothetical protein
MPAVTAEGDRWVVAWTDRRHGGRDVFAARVSPGGSVLDPSGIAVATGEADQRWPVPASAKGRTMIAWATSDGGSQVQARMLKRDGSLSSRSVLAPLRTIAEPPFDATGGARFGIVYEDGWRPDVGYPVLLADIDPATRAVTRRVMVASGDAGYLGNADLTHDGSRFVLRGVIWSEYGGGYGWVASVSGNQVRRRTVDERLFGASLASLPSGRSLLVGRGSIVPTLAVAPVVDAP